MVYPFLPAWVSDDLKNLAGEKPSRSPLSN